MSSSSRADLLKDFKDARVSVLTCDGRQVVGTLKGYDKATNLILTDCEERVYSENSPMELVPLGFFLLRGDNCAAVGLVNLAKDQSIEASKTFSTPMKPIVH